MQQINEMLAPNIMTRVKHLVGATYLRHNQRLQTLALSLSFSKVENQSTVLIRNPTVTNNDIY